MVMNQVNAAREFKKVLKGSIHQMKHFSLTKKDLEIFRKFLIRKFKNFKREEQKGL